jgi:serine/threonine protein kinase
VTAPVDVPESGAEVDMSFIALEYVEGQNLEVRIERGPMDANEIVEFGIQIADALDEAHRKGITHRDMKPSNIVITTRNQAKVLDFGLAKMTAQAAESSSVNRVLTQLKTNPGSVMGTVQFMSPEQALEREVDPRTDIFSMGVVLMKWPLVHFHSPLQPVTKLSTASFTRSQRGSSNSMIRSLQNLNASSENALKKTGTGANKQFVSSRSI